MTVKPIKLPAGNTCLVFSSGHSPYSGVVYLDLRGRFLFATDDEGYRCLDEDEMYQYAALNAPTIGIPQPGPKPGKKGRKGELN